MRCRASGKIEDELPNRRAEEKRLGELVQRLQPQIDAAVQLAEERTRGVPYLEEGRRQDVKRLLVVEQESVNHLKKLDLLAGKLQVLEDALGKISPRFEPLAIRLSEHDKQLDDLRASDFRLQQQVKSFESMVNQLRDQVTDYTDRVEQAARTSPDQPARRDRTQLVPGNAAHARGRIE